MSAYISWGALWNSQRIATVNQYCAQFNSLAPRKFELKFREVMFKLILMIDGWGVFHEIAQRWTSLNLTEDKSTLVQVMAWCRQATSHYLSQCWPRPMSPYGAIRPQWVRCLHSVALAFPCAWLDYRLSSFITSDIIRDWFLRFFLFVTNCIVYR